MDYKETLHMPKTAFEMRGNLTKKEPGFQKRWQDEKLYEKMLERREGAESFVLHDGPPYANGDIHLGHALNKVLKDVIIKSHFMEGYKTPYIPGWDTHGLPIETAVTKLGYDRKKMGIAEFRKICYDYALKQVANQKAGFLSLGSIGDYDHPYITLQKGFEKHQIEIFGKMAMKGLIYKGLKPVYWSPSSESALAEAEVEYKDVKSPTIYVKFAVKDGKGVLDTDCNFVIWTTTPWTIPANLGISVNPDFDYSLVDTEKGKLIMLSSMVDELCDKFEVEKRDVLKTFKGKEFEYITCTHPLYPERESLLMCGDHVTADAGTGCVHTAPGFGVDDFNIGMKYGLPVYCNVDAQGCMMDDVGEWLAGQYVEDANKTVTQKLDELGVLLKLQFITHSYPHDWRTKKPIIFRATTQWFASIDQIRDELLEQIHSVSWVPAWGEQRMHNMIADRNDWCISRQRAWGVPIPIIYGEDDTPIMDQAIFDHVAKLVGEYGSNVWFERDVKDLLPEGYTNEHSPNGIFRKETDTMDVWFDSGSSHTGAMMDRGLGYPADLYFEGSDQYRGWFNSSLIIGGAAHGNAPYKTGLSQKPKFIKKTSTQSFRLQCTSKDKLKCKRLYLNDYGTFKLHDKREIQGKLKEVIIKKHNSQWFIILKCSDISITEYPKTNKKVGIDLGIKNLIIMSDGKSIKPPNISKIESKINKYNRKLSKQKENSKNYQKTVLMLHKLYIKRTNIIEDNLHKIAMEIVKDYDFIAMESLDIRNMIKNRRYSHSIYNMNWARLIKLIKINAELNNKTFIQIPQNYPSTKTCSNCKTINNNVTIDVREWECPKCNTYHDRDINAAKNILYKAIEMS